MTDRNLKIFIGLILFIGVSFILAKIAFTQHGPVESYSSCVEAGHRVMDGSPSQCITPEGSIFSEPNQANGLQERETEDEHEAIEE